MLANTFKLELIKNEQVIETETSGSRLDLINKARTSDKDFDKAIVKNTKFDRIVWRKVNQ